MRKLGWPSRLTFGAAAAVNLVGIYRTQGVGWAVVAVVGGVVVSALVIRHDRRKSQ